MSTNLSYIGVVQHTLSWSEDFRQSFTKAELISEKKDVQIPDILFTMPSEDFLHIENMGHITCNFMDILQFNVSAYIHSINKIKGKHKMYAITLHVDSSIVSQLKPGMLTNVQIELSDQVNRYFKKCV